MATLLPHAAAGHDRASPADELRRLRTQLERAQAPRVDAPPLPVHPLLAELLPEGGLRPGSSYAISASPSLLLALISTASQAGSWCAAIGMPTLGAEAAASFGVDLERLVLIPEPGQRWLAVAAAVAEVLPIVAVRPQGRARDGDVARLSARLRDRGTVLLVLGDWPGADALLSVSEPYWSGVEAGHGYLEGREVTVTASSRRSPVPRSARMLLPGPDGGLDVRTPARDTNLAPPIRIRAAG
ncbi:MULTISPECIES: hypothetical protein [unclassified Microbacterium]|uniref:hypothetical protein n=1 Tax=unclassified Microbacterium TaxID=2609290 RepID=UPI000C2BE9EA|nr:MULTISPECIES: hypothetical protein [unclassified Microbacterium]